MYPGPTAASTPVFYDSIEECGPALDMIMFNAGTVVAVGPALYMTTSERSVMWNDYMGLVITIGTNVKEACWTME